jgi:ubiquinone/menaquinone biosynthesis C-methylase UbiE
MNSASNAEQIEHWNDQMGRTWALMHRRLDRQLTPIGRAAMAKVALTTGTSVLDVGCGCGETTFEIAGKVAPGEVLGVDVSSMLLDIARENAPANVRFLEADAQTHRFEAGAFDVLFSRFGVMFFDDPQAAFANLRRALRPGGRLAFACWRNPKENQWLALPLQATSHLLPPMPPPDPNAPGPFAFADADRVKSILAGAGFTDVGIEPLDLRTGGDSLDDSVELALRVGQLGGVLRQIGASDALKHEVEQTLRDALAAHVEDGVVRMRAAAWIVSAGN